MKTKLFLVSLFALASMPSFANEADRYDCGDYTLTVQKNGAARLENTAAHSSTELTVAGPSSGFGRTTIFSGALVPEGMNLLVRVEVIVDNPLLEGASNGTIAIASDLAAIQPKKYACTRE